MTHGTIANADKLFVPAYGAQGGIVTYHFYQSLPSFYNQVSLAYRLADGTLLDYSDPGVFAAFGADEVFLAGTAMDLISAVAPLVFSQASAGSADIGFGAVTAQVVASDGRNIDGYAYTNYSGSPIADDIWLLPSGRTSNTANTMLHEILHSMGFGEGMDTLPGDEDYNQFSVMSYNSWFNTGFFATDLQLYDIASLQKVYGAKAANQGETVHEEFIRGGLNRHYSIWDSDGEDTISAEQGSGPALIDLRPGYFSSLGKETGVTHDDRAATSEGIRNVSIAFGSQIENATGGAGNDVIIGNALSNVLIGSGGSDLIYAEGFGYDNEDGEYDRFDHGLISVTVDPLQQADILLGGAGDDFLFDGRGLDLLAGGADDDKIRLMNDLAVDFVLGGDGDDEVAGSNGSDVIFGDELSHFEKPGGLGGAAAEAVNLLDSNRDLVAGALPGDYQAGQVGGADRINGGAGNDLVSGGKGDDQLWGGEGDDLLLGDADSDRLYGDSGNDMLFGGSGNDYLEGGEGDDFLHGGSGHDTVKYTTSGFTIDYVHTDAGYDGLTVLAEGTDRLVEIEQVFLEAKDVTVFVERNIFQQGIDVQIFAQSGGRDLLSLSSISDNLKFDFGRISSGPSIGGSIDAVTGGGISFIGFEELVFGSGNDRVSHNVVNSVIDLGAGDDVLFHAAGGTEVYGGDGVDRYRISDNVRIMDATEEDRVYFGIMELTGGIRNVASASPYATHISFLVSYGINGDGDLVIRDNIRKDEMFVANYDNRLDNRTLGLHIAQVEIGAYKLLDPNKPAHLDGLSTWQFFLGDFLKANFGVSMWAGVDPLVLDLDGDGIELRGASVHSPGFDYDGDGYAERGGWVGADDGMLVLDANNDGQVNDGSELFGGPSGSGFSELAGYDLNLDGLINASDAVFSQLSVWRDINQNRTVDAGELVSLASVGITGIGVVGATSSATSAGNAILATGQFTRADGTTGVVADVGFNLNQQETVWLGDRTISAAAQALPELKGYGTLTDLRVAMTLDPALQTVVASVLQGLDTLDVGAMRDAALPLFTAWADASPVAGEIPPGGHADIPVMTAMIDGSRQVIDYAYRVIVNEETGELGWKSAATGGIISVDSLLAVSPSEIDGSQWSLLDGEWIDFFERYLGEALPLDQAPTSGGATIDGMQGVIEGLWQTAERMAVRLAVQGPLAEFFEGVVYDVVSDGFLPTTDRQLIPVFEAIFTEAAGLGAGGLARLEAWDAVLDVVVGDYRQPGDLMNTHGFVFANIVAAYESVGLSLDIVDVASAFGLPADLVQTGLGMIVGTDDADLFYLGAGDQTAVGGLGPDTYVVGRGFGHDVINDLEPALSEHSEDTIRFADIASTEVTARREGVDLILSVNGTTDELRIVNHFDGRLPGTNGGGDFSDSTGVDVIVFADGVIWEPLDVARQVSRFTAGADVIVGTETVDWLDGGAGDDFLSGSSDSDIYVYGRGYGHDVISDLNQHVFLSGPDFVSFTDGITFGDLRFHRDGDGNNLLITVEGQNGSLTLINEFGATYTGVFGTQWIDQIEGFLFDDGSSADWHDVVSALLAQVSTNADDVIYGFSLEDRLDGGAGDDFLSGGNENDTYVFGRGYGADVVQDRLDNILSGSQDAIEFKADVAPDDVAFARDGDDLVITITDTGDTLRIVGQYAVTETGVFGAWAFDQVETFRFADGSVVQWPDLQLAILQASQTSGDDLILGTHFADTFKGGAGNDRIEGGNGGDTYHFGLGDGADVIQDRTTNLLAEGSDTLVFGAGIAAADIRITRYGTGHNSVTLAIDGTGDSVSIESQFNYTTIGFKEYEVEGFAFADGTLWTANDLRLHYITQIQTSGDDVIEGFWTDDVIEGGLGDDLLRGGDGSDAYRFELGFGSDEMQESVDNVSYADNDAVVFGAGLLSTDVLFTRNGDNLTITFAGQTDSLLIRDQFLTQAYFSGWSDIESFTFGDGVTLTDADIRVRLLAASSTFGDDVIVGFSGADVFDGEAGDDVIHGLGGGDTYLLGVGSGHDTIVESIANVYEDQPDTLAFGVGLGREDVVFSRDSMDLLVTLSASGDSVRIQDHFGSSGYASVERFAFAGGLVLSKAEIGLIVLANASTPGDDIITGTNGNDVITGGAGNDILRGLDGSDAYYFAPGFGVDVIEERVDNVSIADFDLIEFGAGLDQADAIVSRNGLDLIIAFPEGDSVTVTGHFGHLVYFEGWSDIEQVRFADGTSWTAVDIRERILAQDSTAGSDVITGFWSDDVIDGGAGNDTLAGLGGDDTYLFGFGSGHDTIDESQTDFEGADDTVALKPGVAPSDVTFTRTATDLVATLSGGLDSITLRNFFTGAAREVEQFTFADGSVMTAAQAVALAIAAQPTSGDDAVLGSRFADILTGGAGRDTLSGGVGSDTYVFEVGDGHDVIDDNGAGEADEIQLGAGFTTANVVLYRSGDHLVIEGAGGDTLLVKNQFVGTSGPIETIRFADATAWTSTEIAAHLHPLVATEFVGTFVGESLTGTSASETFRGREGTDTLTGAGGSDVYIYAPGDGSDTISDTSSSTTDVDALRLTGIDSDEVILEQAGYNLRVVIGDEVITILNHFQQTDAGQGIETIEFADVTWNRSMIAGNAWIRGTDGNDTISTGSGDSVIVGGLGNDVLAGGAGADTYRYRSGDGNDRIVEDNNLGSDVLYLTDLLATDVLLTRNSYDLVVNVLATGQTIRFDYHFLSGASGDGYGVEVLRFADGSTWDRAAIAGNVWIYGTSASETLYGTNADERFYGALGNDVLAGGAGSDTFLYLSGDGNDQISEDSGVGADVLDLGNLNISNVEFGRAGANLLIRDLTTGQTVNVEYHFLTGTTGNGYGVETVRFADDTEWDRAQIAQAAWFRGTSASETVYGSGAADTLFGGLGNDTLAGGDQADVYIYRSGDGSDVIADDSSTGADTLYLVDLLSSEVSVTRSGAHLLITVLSTSEVIKAEYHFLTGPTSNGYGIEQIRFADNEVWFRQTISDVANGLGLRSSGSDDFSDASSKSGSGETDPWVFPSLPSGGSKTDAEDNPTPVVCVMTEEADQAPTLFVRPARNGEMLRAYDDAFLSDDDRISPDTFAMKGLEPERFAWAGTFGVSSRHSAPTDAGGSPVLGKEAPWILPAEGDESGRKLDSVGDPDSFFWVMPREDSDVRVPFTTTSIHGSADAKFADDCPSVMPVEELVDQAEIDQNDELQPIVCLISNDDVLAAPMGITRVASVAGHRFSDAFPVFVDDGFYIDTPALKGLRDIRFNAPTVDPSNPDALSDDDFITGEVGLGGDVDFAIEVRSGGRIESETAMSSSSWEKDVFAQLDPSFQTLAGAANPSPWDIPEVRLADEWYL